MNRFLKYWRMKRCDEAFRAQVVSYADDFVILTCGKVVEALEWTDKVMSRLNLRLNDDKTSMRDGLQGNFDFLDYTFGFMVFKKDGSRVYVGQSLKEQSKPIETESKETY